MDKLILPLENAHITIETDNSMGFALIKMYLVTSEERYLGSKSQEQIQKNAEIIKDKFEQYLNGTLQTEFDETGLFWSFETLMMANFVYKDHEPRVKFYFTHYVEKTEEILEFGIDDEMIREWIDQLNSILSE